MGRLAAVVIGVLLCSVGIGLLTPRLQERFITYFDEARDSWSLPRGKASRFSAIAGGVVLIVLGLAMALGGYRT
jgi:uncharacterized membrane protein